MLYKFDNDVDDDDGDDGGGDFSRPHNLRLKNRVSISTMWTATCVDEVSEVVRAPDRDRSVVIGWPMTNVVATFDSVDVKQQFEVRLKR